jgi:hypothetical protein
VKQRHRRAALAAALVTALAASPGFLANAQEATKAWGKAAKPQPKLESGFKRILGDKNLDGWKQCGPGKFVQMTDGTWLGTGGMGMLWYAARPYKNFTMKVDWKAEKASDNAGVFVRFPDPKDDPWIAVNQGHEVQIADAGDEKHKTGAVYTFSASAYKPTKPYGEWNTMEITVIGPKYTVKVNGAPVTEYTSDRSLEGYIGIQNHSSLDIIGFRNIRVKELK